MVIFYTTSILVLFCLCAACDVWFENNKWLDVFKCHVKPWKGHVLSEHIPAIGGSLAPGSGFWVDAVCVEALSPAEWALCQVSVTSVKGLLSKVIASPMAKAWTCNAGGKKRVVQATPKSRQDIFPWSCDHRSEG